MAIDWGDVISVVGDFAGGMRSDGYDTPFVMDSSPSYVAPQPNYAAVTAPRPAHLRCKRRRRRRLLTESDFNDLMRIATLPNKQNVAVALAKAVGRR